MPAFEVVSPDGRKFRVEGDAPPGEGDLDEIFKAQSAADSLRFQPTRELVPTTESDIQETAAMGSPVRNLAQGLNTAGKGAVAALGDAGSVAFRPVLDELYPEQATPGSVDLENLRAFEKGQPLPAKDLRNLGTPARMVGTAAQGLIETAPKIGAVAGLEAIGVPAPIGAAAVFGSTEEGFDPKQAAVAAALPFVGKYSGAMVEALASKLGVTKDAALTIFNKMGGAIGAAALLKGVDETEIAKLPPEQRDEARIESWANIAGQSVLGMMGGRDKKGAPNAVPERSTKAVPVEEPSGSGPEVGARIPEPEKPAGAQGPIAQAEAPPNVPAQVISKGAVPAAPSEGIASPEMEPSSKAAPAEIGAAPSESPGPMNMAGQVRQPKPKPAPVPPFETLPQKTRDAFERAWQERDEKNMGLLLDPMNRGLRAEWEKRTGEPLPKQIGNTHAKVRNYFLFNPEAEATKPTETTTIAAAEVEAEVKQVAATEGQRPAKEVKTELVSRLEKAIEDAPNERDVERKTATKVSGETYESSPDSRTKITINIPGDGEFTIWNTKENLAELLKKAKRLDTKPVGGRPKEVKQTKSGEQHLKYQPASDLSVGPGAASPSDFPKDSDLQQLSSSIQGKLSPNQTISQRINTALDAGKEWARTRKDNVASSLANVRASSAALLDGYLNLPKWTDFTKSIGEWVGADQKTALEVREFLKKINKAVPEKARQEAITNWIQADGNESVLRERAAQSKPGLRKGYELALKLNDGEKTLARNIQSYLESRLQEGINAGILKSGVKDYVNQIWKRDNSVTQKLWADLFGIGTLNPNFKFAKKRIFESYFQGEQSGFTPKNKSIGHLLGVYDLAFNRAISARAMIKQLQSGVAADGKPISMTSGRTSPVPAGETPPEAFLIKPNLAPEGAVSADGRPYRPIDHWALRDWKWATKGPEGQDVFVQGDMLIHPDHYQHLNNVLKSSRLASPEGITGLTTRPLLKLGALAKQTKLSLSPFHLVQEGVHAMAHRVDPTGLLKELPDIDLNDAKQKSLVDHGLMVQDPRASELFSEGLSGGGLVGKIPGLGYLQTAFNDMLFKDYIPRLKMAMALDALDRNMEGYKKEIATGKVSADQIMAHTARESNAAFGEQNYRMMGRSPTLQDFLRIALLAPDFLEARARFVGQALKPYGREQRIALALMGGVMYVGGRLMNQYLDDDPHWNKPFSIFYKGKEYRLRTILGDVQHLITDPRSFWYNRLGFITRTASEYITGRDDRGIKRSSMEQFKDLAEWFRPIPTQVRSDQTRAQAVLAATGVPSKTYGAQQQLFDKLDDWRSKQSDLKIKEQYDAYRQETHKDSIYRPLRDALNKNDMDAARQSYAELLKSRKPADVDKAMRPFTVAKIPGSDYWETHPKPFTGSKKTEKAFIQSLDASDKKLYEKAKQERLDQYAKFKALLKKK